jgi:hypothetical protein
VLEFDWYPGKPGAGHGRLSIQDGTKASFPKGSPIYDSQFITFKAHSDGKMYYFMGPEVDNEDPRNEVYTNIYGEIPLGGNLDTWFHVTVRINFDNKQLTYSFVNDDSTVNESKTLPLAAVSYENKIGSMRFYASTSNSGPWTTYLDNVRLIGEALLPPDNYYDNDIPFRPGYVD